jgi:hypothetical protein
MNCPTISFDTLHHFERMKKVGFTEDQAKEQTEAIQEIAAYINNDIATKNDTKRIEEKIQELKSDTKGDMKILGAMIILGVTALGLLIKL